MAENLFIFWPHCAARGIPAPQPVGVGGGGVGGEEGKPAYGQADSQPLITRGSPVNVLEERSGRPPALNLGVGSHSQLPFSASSCLTRAWR